MPQELALPTGNLPARRDDLPTASSRSEDDVLTVQEFVLSSELRRPFRLGLLLMLVFFGVGGGWAATAQLAGAVIAPGVVSPESRRQTIQHLEGGIIRAIRVVEGSRVRAGDELFVLQDIDARSDADTLKARVIALAAQEARAQAESARESEIRFLHPALANRNDPIVQEAITRENSRFAARRTNDQQRREIIGQRAAVIEQQIIGSTKQIEGVREQIKLLRQEMEVVEDLVNRGLERLPRLLGLKRGLAERIATEGELVANVARAHEQIEEARMQRMNVDVQRLEQVESEFAETRGKRAEAEEQIRKSLDRLRRTVIRSPVDGVVLNVRFKTTDGVVRPGESILDIVPTEDKLFIDTRISPKDVDKVRVGASAYVIFPSFPQRRLHRISGTVTHVSSDALQDDKTGERYFQGKVEVDRAHLHQVAPNNELMPGLPAQVFISTVERTVLEYLLQPLQLVIERGMRES